MTGSGTEQRRLAAIMFTDMVAYSALAQRSEALALELLEEHRQILRALFVQFSGREVKTIGDAFLVEFQSAVAAVQCGIEIQRTLAKRNTDTRPERHIQVRIGVHIGDVVHREGDLYGDGVNIASRIEPLAGPGGICVSMDVERQIRNQVEVGLVRLQPKQLKHIQTPMELFRVALPWEQAEAPPGTPLPATEAGQAAPPLSRSRPRLSLPRLWSPATLALSFLLLAAVAGWLWSRNRVPARPAAPAGGPIRALAVKPLDDFSGDTNQAYLSDGMTEALCAALGNISALRVPGRSSVMRFKGTTKTIQEMARELKVDAIVEGSVQRAGTRLLVTVQLIEADTDRHLWATNFERDLGGFFNVQSEVAQALARAVQVRLTPEEETRLARARPVNRDALEAYLIGMHHWWHWTDNEALKALECFEKALTLDAGYAPAYLGVSLACQFAGDASTQSIARARAAAQKAIELDPELAEAYAARADIRFYNDWDWAGAENDYRHALQLSPRSTIALDLYNNFLSQRGRFDEAIAVMEQALQVDPLAPGLHSDLALTLHQQRRFTEAIARYQKVLELDPSFEQAHWGLGWCYFATGKTGEAEAEFKQAIRIAPDALPDRYGLVNLYRSTGRAAEAAQAMAAADELAKGRQPAPSQTALRHLVLGETDLAMAALEAAYAQRDQGLVSIKTGPQWDALRGNPRFQALVRKLDGDAPVK